MQIHPLLDGLELALHRVRKSGLGHLVRFVQADLLTTDRDFDHLDGMFLRVIYIDQSLTPADAS